MNQRSLLALLVFTACSNPVEGLPADGGVLDADAEALVGDGGVDADVQPLSDAGPFDAGVLSADAGAVDAGWDAGATDPCPAPNAVYDPVALRCIYRVRYMGGAVCPGQEWLHWEGVEDQQRIQMLVRPLGAAGTSLLKNAFTGSWTFMSTGGAPGVIDWAPGQPSASEQYSFIGTDGLHSYFRAYGWQFCLGPVL